MAANMIGVKKYIIVFCVGDMIVPMVNPVILKKEKSYKDIKRSCLSLIGFRKTMRYETIEVEYFDRNFKEKETFTGFMAYIIQHEVDHCNGIII